MIAARTGTVEHNPLQPVAVRFGQRRAEAG